MSLRIARFDLDTLVASEKSGEGVLWKGHDQKSGQEVAVKVLAAPAEEGSAVDSEVAQRYAALAADDRGWVPILAIGASEVDDDVFAGRPAAEGRHGFCVREWVVGRSLEETLEAGALGSEAAARLGSRIAHRVAAAHAVDVAHLRIKPSNVLLTEDGPLLVDCFTVWGELGDRRAGGRAMATACYLAPEQKPAPGAGLYSRTEEAPGPRSDVFALGVLIAALATGSALPSDAALDELDPELREILERAQEREPEHRYASALGLARALDLYVAPDAEANPNAQAALRRWLVGGAAFSIMTALLIVIVQTWDRSHDSAPGGAEPERLAASSGGDESLRPQPGSLRPDSVVPPSDLTTFAAREPATADSPASLEAAEVLGRRAALALSNYSFHPADLPLLRSVHGDLAVEVADLVLRFGAQPSAPYSADRLRLLQLFQPIPAATPVAREALAKELGRLETELPLAHAPHPDPSAAATLLQANAVLSSWPIAAGGELSPPADGQAATEPLTGPGRVDATTAWNATDDHPTSALFRAQAALRIGAGREARIALAGVGDPRAEPLLAIARFQERGADLSATEREHLVELAERYAILNVEAGVLALDLGDPAAALHHFDRALARYPEHAGARHHRAIALWRLGHKDAAHAELAALDLAPPAGSAELAFSDRSSATYLIPSDQPARADASLRELLD